MGVQERQQRVDFGADLRVAVERIDGCQRKQHEGVVVGIAQRVQHRAIGRQRVHEARPAVGAPGFGQEMLQPLQRDLAALRIPADLRRLGEAIDLPGLHEHAPRRETIGAAVAVEPVDEAADCPDPSLRPDHNGSACSIMRSFRSRDDVDRIVRRGGLCFSHYVPSGLSNTGGRRLIPCARRGAIGLNTQDQP